MKKLIVSTLDLQPGDFAVYDGDVYEVVSKPATIQWSSYLEITLKDGMTFEVTAQVDHEWVIVRSA